MPLWIFLMYPLVCIAVVVVLESIYGLDEDVGVPIFIGSVVNAAMCVVLMLLTDSKSGVFIVESDPSKSLYPFVVVDGHKAGINEEYFIPRPGDRIEVTYRDSTCRILGMYPFTFHVFHMKKL